MRRSLFLAICLSLFVPSQASSTDDLNIRGWVEHARVMPERLLMTAKLDSGARTTSIHAEILSAEEVKDLVLNGEIDDVADDTEIGAQEMFNTSMVEGSAPDDPPAEEISPISDASISDFMSENITFRLTSRGGKEVIITEPVVRWVSIRRRGGGAIVRPVVMMELCLAGLRVRGEVNLADRTGFNYPLLIGRNMLSDAGISIDSRQVFASKKACDEPD
ncbi:MAG: RimK/LysX family protein [Pseudomonadota bacterium]